VGPLTSLSGLENLCMSAANWTIIQRCETQQEVLHEVPKNMPSIKHCEAITLEAADACHL
jgi:hypothetical protein